MKSRTQKLTIVGVALVLLIVPSLFSFSWGCRKASPPPMRTFLQTRQELLEKYGQPTSVSPSRMITPGEHLKFRSSTLDIEADIYGDQCHYIHYTLPQVWTDAQIAVALDKNGTGWRSQPSVTAFMPPLLRYASFTSKEGHLAKYGGPLHWLEVWSCQLVQQAKVAQEIKERKATEIPRF